jgi:hypothetical protein
VEVLVAEVRRRHPRWGAKRIRMELLRRPVAGLVVPSPATINRILVRRQSAQIRVITPARDVERICKIEPVA